MTAPDRMRLVFNDSVKNHEVLDTPLPDWLAALVWRYLDMHRKVLLQGQTHSSFWINREGRPLDATALRSIFARLGMRIVGRPINVHSTRHGLATAIMTRDPRDIEIASAALAHRGTASVNRVYDRSGAETAHATFRM